MKERFRVLGGGVYGCQIAVGLVNDGHDVELHEIAPRLFAGASGSSPARLHRGFHYPRSRLTRAACQDHHAEFMAVYGDLTRHVPINIYAIAEHDSIIDYGTYVQVLKGEVEFVQIRPADFGLEHVEGAILTGERHIVIDEARRYFEKKLEGRVRYCRAPGVVDDPGFGITIDATFCANDAEAIDRYEPCVTALLEGPVDTAVTIMDGPKFGSIYPWNEQQGLSSLTNAGLTPLSKTCRTYAEAKALLDSTGHAQICARTRQMLDEMAYFWPAAKERYRIVDEKLSIRAMPRSGADARLVDVVRVGERALRVRAGKIDAIFHAERLVKEMIAA